MSWVNSVLNVMPHFLQGTLMYGVPKTYLLLHLGHCTFTARRSVSGMNSKATSCFSFDILHLPKSICLPDVLFKLPELFYMHYLDKLCEYTGQHIPSRIAFYYPIIPHQRFPFPVIELTHYPGHPGHIIH